MDKPRQIKQTFTKRDGWLTLEEEKFLCPIDIWNIFDVTKVSLTGYVFTVEVYPVTNLDKRHY